MALDAHDDRLMPVNGFPINLKGEDKTFHTQGTFLLTFLC